EGAHRGQELAQIGVVASPHGGEELERVLDRGEQQVLLAAEVPVDRGAGDPYRVGDLGDAHVVIPGRAELLRRDRQDLLSAVARAGPVHAGLGHCTVLACCRWTAFRESSRVPSMLTVSR